MRQYVTVKTTLWAPPFNVAVAICCSKHFILGLPFETLWTKHFYLMCTMWIIPIQNLFCFQSCFLFIFSEVVMNFLKKTCFVIHQSVTNHILMSLFKAECSKRNHLISFLEKNYVEIYIQVIFIFVVSNICNSQVKTLIILLDQFSTLSYW